jgi:hypothetical protein
MVPPNSTDALVADSFGPSEGVNRDAEEHDRERADNRDLAAEGKDVAEELDSGWEALARGRWHLLGTEHDVAEGVDGVGQGVDASDRGEGRGQAA